MVEALIAGGVLGIEITYSTPLPRRTRSRSSDARSIRAIRALPRGPEHRQDRRAAAHRGGGTGVLRKRARNSPDERAAALEARMTDAERLRLLHSTFARPDRTASRCRKARSSSASFTPGIPRLGIPALRETDASLGVAAVNGLRHDGATALPSSLSLASSSDRDVARRGSAADREGSAREGLQRAAGRRRQSRSRAAQRPKLRIPRRGSAPGRHPRRRDGPRDPVRRT